MIAHEGARAERAACKGCELEHLRELCGLLDDRMQLLGTGV